jgi:hypothetical protein
MSHILSKSPTTRRVEETDLDKGLDSAPPLHLLSTHTAGDFSWVTLDAGNDRVGVGTLLGSLIELLDNYDLLACLTALQDNSNLGAHHETSAQAGISRVKALFTFPGL